MTSGRENHDTKTGAVSTEEPLSRLSHASLDIVLDALANAYRRRLLTALSDRDERDDLVVQLPAEAVASASEMDQYTLSQVHTHLPKLEDMGFIEWDRDTNDVRKGPRFEEVRSFLQVLQNHADELPDDLV